MNRKKQITTLILFIFSFNLFGQTVGKDWGIAVSETMASNMTLAMFNRFVFRFDFAQTTPDVIHDHLTTAWVWDQDQFAVNQLGHPYQGSFYFTSGRANNLGFYQSLACSVLGSVTWEYFAETDQQSLNDLICTTFGSAALGEVFHRTYLETSRFNKPLSFIVSPMDFINEKITKHTPVRDNKIGITKYEIYEQIGFLKDNAISDEEVRFDTKSIPMIFTGGFNMVYGDPFVSKSDIPFSYYIFNLEGGGNKNFYEVKTDIMGSLFRIGEKDYIDSRAAGGIDMLFDVNWTKLSAYSSNGIGFYLVTEEFYPFDININRVLTVNCSIFSAGDYYKLYRGYIEPPNDGDEHRLYNYGYGFCAWYKSEMSLNRFGKLLFSFKSTGIFDIPSAVPDGACYGYNLIFDYKLSYEHLVTEILSFGVSGNIYIKYENITRQEDMIQHTYMLNLYSKQTLKKL